MFYEIVSSKVYLEILDIIFHFFHVSLILWNLLGWMYKKWITVHFFTLNLVLFSWIVLGFFYGFGYCFLTDYHWKIKYQKGEYYLPGSYIEYILQKLGFSFESFHIDISVLIITLILYFLSLYRFLRR